MAIDLVICSACGMKNASHRKVCLRCGASISTPTESKRTKRLSFSERLRQLFGKDASTQNSDAVWLNLLTEDTDPEGEGTKELKQVVTSFLIPDKISPFKFRANWIALSQQGFMFDDDDDINPTPSLQRFSRLVTNRPGGYPEWFFAAYPDVASWATSLADAVTVGAAAPEAETILFHNIFGKISEVDRNELLDSDRHIKGEYLRALIDHYRRETGRTLECM